MHLNVIDDGWLWIVVCVGLYLSDYALTLNAALLYRRGAYKHLVFEKAYEPDPNNQKARPPLWRLSPRFIGTLVAIASILFVLWRFSVWLKSPEGYELILGFPILFEIANHTRHVNNLFLYRSIADSEGIEGRVVYRRWLSLRQSAVNFLTFGVLCLALALATGSWFFVGGCIGCGLVARLGWRRSNGELKRTLKTSNLA